MNQPMQHGTVSWFSPTRGLGAVTADDGREVFLRAYEIDVRGDTPLAAGARVAFVVRETDDGAEAAHLHVLGADLSLFGAPAEAQARSGAASATPRR